VATAKAQEEPRGHGDAMPMTGIVPARSRPVSGATASSRRTEIRWRPPGRRTPPCGAKGFQLAGGAGARAGHRGHHHDDQQGDEPTTGPARYARTPPRERRERRAAATAAMAARTGGPASGQRGKRSWPPMREDDRRPGDDAGQNQHRVMAADRGQGGPAWYPARARPRPGTGPARARRTPRTTRADRPEQASHGDERGLTARLSAPGQGRSRTRSPGSTALRCPARWPRHR